MNEALGSIRQLSIAWVDPVREIIELTRQVGSLFFVWVYFCWLLFFFFSGTPPRNGFELSLGFRKQKPQKGGTLTKRETSMCGVLVFSNPREVSKTAGSMDGLFRGWLNALRVLETSH